MPVNRLSPYVLLSYYFLTSSSSNIFTYTLPYLYIIIVNSFRKFCYDIVHAHIYAPRGNHVMYSLYSDYAR